MLMLLTLLQYPRAYFSHPLCLLIISFSDHNNLIPIVHNSFTYLFNTSICVVSDLQISDVPMRNKFTNCNTVSICAALLDVSSQNTAFRSYLGHLLLPHCL